LAYLEANGITGIKGFPTVGGFRASMYNGMPIEGVQYLVDLLKNYTI
jgi:phosphoserine aminotransferase